MKATSTLSSLSAVIQGRVPSNPSDEVPAGLARADYEPVQTDVGTVWIAANDQVMRPYMERFGRWEPEEGDLLRSLVRPGCRFLDVGANVGYFSLLVAQAAPGVRVDAVEPHPANVRALRFNLWVNRVRAQVWPVALDDRDRSLTLSDNQTNFGDFRSGRVDPVRKRDPLATERQDDGSLVVPAAAGSELFGDRGFDLVKIDVQGWELEVLTGLEPVLRRSKVQIVTEFWPHSLRGRDRDPVACLDHYRSLGYQLRVAVADELRVLPDKEIVHLCDSGGESGQVNLLLER